ncbi:segregation/condensation protein A, partial [bacterium]|nr:segregation/condensation protein A [bacterium]
KSRMLLPADQQISDTEDDQGEDPRWELIRQLVEYKKFKDAARQLAQREDEQSRLFPRRVGDDVGIEVEESIPLAEVSIFDLITAFNEVLQKASAREQFSEIVEESFTVSDKIEEILYTLRDQADVHFSELFATAGSRAEVVVTFLALLELIRLKRLRVQQSEAFGEIKIIKVV